MRYELQTIPVWDAYKTGGPCPFCLLHKDLEARYVEFFLGGALMAPEIRVEVNRRGFCPRHWMILYRGGNKLGLALMIRTYRDASEARIAAALQRVAGRGGDKVAAQVAAGLQAELESCLVCAKIEHTMDNYRYTVARLWSDDPEFRQAFGESSGFCRVHLPRVLEVAAGVLGKSDRERFCTALAELTASHEAQEARLLDAWIDSFDYRKKRPLSDAEKDGPAANARRLAGLQSFEELSR